MIYKIFTFSHRSELKISRKFIILNFVKILRIFRKFANFVEIWRRSQRNLLKFCVQSGAKLWKSCRSRKIWKNAPFLAIVAVDTAENEPSKNLQTAAAKLARVIVWRGRRTEGKPPPQRATTCALLQWRRAFCWTPNITSSIMSNASEMDPLATGPRKIRLFDPLPYP